MDETKNVIEAIAFVQSTPHLAVSISELLELIGIGRTRAYELINSGVLPARKVGRRTLILREDLQVFLRNLPVIGK